MQGTADKAGTAVLMVAYNGENCVRLLELPSRNTRGVLAPVCACIIITMHASCTDGSCGSG